MANWDTVRNKIILIFVDIIIIVGIVLIGYGLYLFKPWVSYTVEGAILLMLGMMVIMRR